MKKYFKVAKFYFAVLLIAYIDILFLWAWLYPIILGQYTFYDLYMNLSNPKSSGRGYMTDGMVLLFVVIMEVIIIRKLKKDKDNDE